MIDNFLITAILACIAYVVNDIGKTKSKDNWDIDRESDATIEVIGGRFILKEK